MKSGRLKFGGGVAPPASAFSQHGLFPGSSPYKNAANPRFDANSFPETLSLSADDVPHPDALLLPSPFLQRLLAHAGRGQHLIECGLLPQVLQ
jgi:hypothetical protein